MKPAQRLQRCRAADSVRSSPRELPLHGVDLVLARPLEALPSASQSRPKSGEPVLRSGTALSDTILFVRISRRYTLGIVICNLKHVPGFRRDNPNTQKAQQDVVLRCWP